MSTPPVQKLTTDHNEFLRGNVDVDRDDLPPPIKRARELSRAPSSMSADELAALREKNAADQRASVDAAAAESAKLRDLPVARRRLAAEFDAELALDVGTSAAALQPALDARKPTSPLELPIWVDLTAHHGPRDEMGYRGDPDFERAIEARHCAVGIGKLPKVRTDDPVYGGDAAARVRQLPTIERQWQLLGGGWYEQWLLMVGLSLPFANIPDEPRDRIARIHDATRRGLYDRNDDDRNSALAAAEYKAVADEYKRAVAAAKAAHAVAVLEQRKQVVAVLDAKLGELALSPAWWWLREFRRHIAGERVRFQYINAQTPPFCWTAALALGVQLDFTAQTKE